MKGRTYVEIFSLANPARPASRWWAELDGHLLTSLRIGERLYVVTRHAPTIQGFDYRFSAAHADNLAVLAAAPLSAFTPQARPNGGSPIDLVQPASMHLAPQGSRRRADFISVVAIDLREARIVDSLAILGPAENAHVTGNDLFLLGRFVQGTGVGAAQRTYVFRVGLGEERLAVTGTGLVDGAVPFNAVQFTTAQQLRVVSRLDGGAARLTILEPGFFTPEFLRSAWALPNPSRHLAIPTPGVVRFAGERLYIASGNSQLGSSTSRTRRTRRSRASWRRVARWNRCTRYPTGASWPPGTRSGSSGFPRTCTSRSTTRAMRRPCARCSARAWAEQRHHPAQP